MRLSNYINLLTRHSIQTPKKVNLLIVLYKLLHSHRQNCMYTCTQVQVSVMGGGYLCALRSWEVAESL